EFAIVLPETPALEALRVAARLLDTVRSGRTHPPITVSLGVSTWRGPGDQSDSIVHRADAALYEAKRGGRNRVRVAPVPAPLSGRNVRSLSSAR
ncbi:MAG: GGDEF domain-containing protein, partial [Acidimicrobiales bacterium]